MANFVMIRAVTAAAAVAFVLLGGAAITLANAIIDLDIDLDDDDR